jgi:hypothetical protein
MPLVKQQQQQQQKDENAQGSTENPVGEEEEEAQEEHDTIITGQRKRKRSDDEGEAPTLQPKKKGILKLLHSVDNEAQWQPGPDSTRAMMGHAEARAFLHSPHVLDQWPIMAELHFLVFPSLRLVFVWCVCR